MSKDISPLRKYFVVFLGFATFLSILVGFAIIYFVFTQINAISHEISHISDFSEDFHHEQHESSELCDECHATNGYKNLYHPNKTEFNTSNDSSHYSIELDSSVSLKKLFHPQLSQGPPVLS